MFSQLSNDSADGRGDEWPTYQTGAKGHIVIIYLTFYLIRAEVSTAPFYVVRSLDQQSLH
jgi:hypothetical protein